MQGFKELTSVLLMVCLPTQKRQKNLVRAMAEAALLSIVDVLWYEQGRTGSHCLKKMESALVVQRE
jgi:hypothetical protein